MMTAVEQAKPHLGVTTLAAGFGFSLIQLDVTIVNVALPRMAAAFGGGMSVLQWVVDAYTLVFAALLLAAGSLGDRFGARRTYLTGLGLFVAASVACGLASSALVLILARIAQGAGAAAMLPCSLMLIGHAAADDPRGRATAVAWWASAGALSIAIGPIAGGLLVGLGDWRTIFLINVPIGAVAAIMVLRAPETAPDKAKRFDWKIQLFAVLALSGITAAIIDAKPYGLGSLPVVGPACVGLFAAGAFAWTERRSPHPMFPPALFKVREFNGAVFYGAMINISYYGMIFVFSFYIQQVLGFGVIRAGLAYLPLTGILFGANLISAWWAGRSGRRWPMVVGALIDAAGFMLLAFTARPEFGYWGLLPSFILIPAGMGLGVPAMTTAVLARVAPRYAGIASATLNAARQSGGAIGVALFGSITGEAVAYIPWGLHVCAVLAAVAMLSAATVAYFTVDPTADAGAPSKA
jgi:DHA2 family methylenomycin A resistance protein-like MFS transporter